MSSLLFGPTDAVDTIVEAEVADLGLMTRFGTGVSALSPFEATRERRRRARRQSGGARLGELLVGEGVLSPDELAHALAAQKKTRPRKPLGEILLTNGVVSPPLLVRLLAQQCQLQLEEETGFGTGLRRAIERRHTERARPEEETGASHEDGTAGGAAAGEPTTVSVGPRLLGELLVAERLLTPEQLRWALAEQAESGRLLGEVVFEHGLVSMVALVNTLTEQLRAGDESGVSTAIRAGCRSSEA
jgi:hypothetical protein